MDTLHALRLRSARYFSVYTWLHIPITIMVAMIVQKNSWPILNAGGVLIALISSYAIRKQPDAAFARYIVAISLMSQAAMLVYAFAGHPWQGDMHIYFYAALAMLVAFCDRNCILIASVALAALYLGTSIWFPTALFAEGSSLGHVALHLVILSVQTGVLLWIVRMVMWLLETAEKERLHAQEEERKMQMLHEDHKIWQEQAIEDRRRMFAETASMFEQRVQNVIGQVTNAANDMFATAESLESFVVSVNGRVLEASRASQQTNDRVQELATATTALSSSINEISGQVNRTSHTVAETVEVTRNVDRQASELDQATRNIGDVLQLIREIAEQINLLALNATIEAARAGEAGKGFAVVANEVKNLANQTAKATEDISAKIEQMQEVSSTVINVLRQIQLSIEHISGYTTTISGAVHEQNLLTGDMTKQMENTSIDSHQIHDNLQEIGRVAGAAEDSSHHAVSAAKDLAGAAERLQQEVQDFLRQLRTEH